MRFCSPAPAGAPGSFFLGFARGQAGGRRPPAEGGHTGAARVGGVAAGPAAPAGVGGLAGGRAPPAPCAILFLCTRGSVSLSRCQVAQFDRLMQGKGPLYWNLHKI